MIVTPRWGRVTLTRARRDGPPHLAQSIAMMRPIGPEDITAPKTVHVCDEAYADPLDIQVAWRCLRSRRPAAHSDWATGRRFVVVVTAAHLCALVYEPVARYGSIAVAAVHASAAFLGLFFGVKGGGTRVQVRRMDVCLGRTSSLDYLYRCATFSVQFRLKAGG